MEGRNFSQQAALTQDFPSAPPGSTPLFWRRRKWRRRADDLGPDLERQEGNQAGQKLLVWLEANKQNCLSGFCGSQSAGRGAGCRGTRSLSGGGVAFFLAGKCHNAAPEGEGRPEEKL